jgi:hypothetical protein
MPEPVPREDLKSRVGAALALTAAVVKTRLPARAVIAARLSFI